MKFYRKISILTCLVSLPFLNVNAQIVVNGDFENGSPNYVGNPGSFNVSVDNWTVGCTNNGTGGSPDIFDVNANCTYSAPANSRSINRPPRLTGAERYAGMAGTESILGELSENLSQCQYDIEFWLAPHDGYGLCNGNYIPYTQPIDKQIEVVLRHSNSPCSSGEVIFTSPVMTMTPDPNIPWQQVSGTFSLTSAQVSQNYDRIEFRHKDETGGWVFIDDISITESTNNSTADAMPVNHIGITTEQSMFGPLDVSLFCQGDVLIDGSGSVNETDYHLSLSAIDINTWTSTNIYSGWISGQAPNNINLINNVIASNVQLIPGQIYVLGLSTGPCWDTKNLFFKVVDCECPTDLQLEADCANNIINILNFPDDLSSFNVTWTYKKKKYGTPTLILDDPQITPSTYMTNGYGWYTVNISFTLPNGQVCTYSESIHVTEDYCCQTQGPSPDVSLFSQDGSIVVDPTPWGPQTLPIKCDGVRINATALDCAEHFFLEVYQFNPSTWTAFPGPPLYSTYSSTSLHGTWLNPYVSFTPGSFYIITYGAMSGGVWHYDYLVFQYENCDNIRVAGNENNEMVENTNSAIEYSIVPNPSNGRFSLMFEEPTSETLKIQVSTVEGQLITIDSPIIKKGSTSKTIDLVHNSEGVYFIRILNDSISKIERVVITQ